MTARDPDRPAPEAFLRAAAQEGRGRLKVFLGAAPGVGKTYEMLTDAAARVREGVDVVIGVVETHGRIETEALTRPFEIMPRRHTEGSVRALDEMDIDAILARKPRLVLVDELAHTNAPGSRHPKRYQDVDELLAAGIDVFSTVNVQHIESLNDVVASFTRVRVRETVPDRMLDDADIEVVDIPPDELIERLKAGKVYVPDEAARALGHFFSRTNLQALRELALRRAAQAVDAEMLGDLRARALAGTFAAGERVLVAVDAAASAAELVRAAKRLADALRAPWTALHVETERTRRLDAAGQSRLAATLALAVQLGGGTATIPAANVVDGLCDFAAEARITQIVVGKSLRSWWFERRYGSVVDALVRGIDGVAVHVLPTGKGAAQATAPRRTITRPMDYLWTLLMVAGVTGIAEIVTGPKTVNSVDMMYLVPVLTAATIWGLRAGVFAGVLSALAYNFFFLPPLYTFTIADPANLVTVLVLLVVAVIVSQLAARTRVQADLAASGARANAALAGFSRQLTGVTTVPELAQSICAEIARLFDVRAVMMLPKRGDLVLVAAVPPGDELGAVELAAARWVADKGRPAGRGSDTLTAADWLFHPLNTGRGTIAVIGMARDDGRDPLRPDSLALLTSVLDQSALALDRIQLEAEMADVAQLRERDRLRATLLASVSHDLRTPLTSIVAAANELRATAATTANTPLFDTLDAETQRLRRFVANLLDMARIEAGALNLNIVPTDLTDAVAGAVHDVRRALADHPIALAVPPDLPLVRIDPQLFHHCLINLLDNAGKYADPGSTVTIAATRRYDGIELTVTDEGPGLPPGSEARIFDTFLRVEGSDRTKDGTGLGLAIVKGFAEAMGLTVAAGTRSDPRGARFAVLFPEALLVRAPAVATEAAE
ncbi:sensor histidine kinase KdpD [Polymorphobacter sp. PAMC 29334]|uniref:sensor histidine kinase n=1 Tax=Polymorphobacter sp. PAMC 29334 TaxID=2862331 RepID=UPI001C66AB55|nr:sensor histidine kinase KdpD [Polymorphobacter sp. PAMC 29334]QYE34630.1 sensor histidine kinase KdpD [Polymorphobacter sp. PAMC 29334]